MIMNTITRLSGGGFTLALIAALAFGCSGEKQTEEECEDPPEKAQQPDAKNTKLERFGLGRAGDEDKQKKDWCRACVMSKVGYASCQKVYADEPGESRDSLKARARDKACKDAKFKTNECPDSAVISLLCKGDPPPAGTPDPGTALQNLHQALSGEKPPVVLTGPRAEGEDEKKEAPAKDEQPAQQEQPKAAPEPAAKQ